MNINKIDASQPNVSPNSRVVLSKNPKQLTEYILDLEAEGTLEDFLDEAVKNDQLVAQLSYWEKWLPERIRKIIDKKIKLERKDMMENEDILPLDLEGKYTPEELEHLLTSIKAMQLTFGCSKGCKHCGFDAVPKVRDEFKYEQLKNLYERYGDKIKRCNLLYHASEPSDYRRYIDVHDLSVEYSGINPHITTAETDKDWIQSLKGRTRGWIRLSLDKNNENFRDASEILTRNEVITLGGNRILIPTPLLQQAIPKGEHDSGIGRSYSENDKVSRGIGSADGVLMTPRGIYNTLQQPFDRPSEEYPQGQVIVPIGQLSAEPITEGQNLVGLLQESFIAYSKFRPDNREADYVMLYRKDGLYDVIFNEDTLEIIKATKIDEHRLNMPSEKSEQGARFESEKESAVMNVSNSFDSYSSHTTSFNGKSYKFENIDRDTGKKVIEFLKQNMSMLKFDGIYPDLGDGIPLSVKWECILTNEDVTELNGPTKVALHYSFPDQVGSWLINYMDHAPQWVAEEKEGARLKYFDKTKKRFKEALEDGRFSISDKDGVADYQQLLEYIYNSDLSFLGITSLNSNEVWWCGTVQVKQEQEEVTASVLVKYYFVEDDIDISIDLN